MPDFPKPTDGPSPTDGPGPGPSKTCYNCGYKCSDMVRKYHTENATYPYPTGKSRSIWAKNGHSDNKFPDHCIFIVQILLNIWDQTFTYQTKHVNNLVLILLPPQHNSYCTPEPIDTEGKVRNMMIGNNIFFQNLADKMNYIGSFLWR